MNWWQTLFPQQGVVTQPPQQLIPGQRQPDRPARIEAQTSRQPAWARTLFGDSQRQYDIDGTNGQDFRRRNALAAGLQSLVDPGEGSYGQRLLRAGISSTLGGLQADNQLEAMERAQMAQRRAEARDDRQIAQGDRRLDLTETGMNRSAAEFDRTFDANQDRFAQDFDLRQRQLDASIQNDAARLGIAQGGLDLQRQQFAFQQQQVEAAAQQAAQLQAAGVLSGDQADTLLKLSDRYVKQSAAPRERLGAVNNLKSAFSQRTNQGDLAAITTFAKVLDPGSVVREGELQLSSGSAVPIFVRQLFGEIANGGLLSDEDRKRITAVADDFVANDQADIDALQGRIRDLARRSNLPAGVVDETVFAGSFDVSETAAVASGNAPDMDPDEAEVDALLSDILGPRYGR